MLGTSLGVGGFWNLPLTCHWLAATRQTLGKDKSLIGINGAQSGLDIARMMLSGASAVAMASAVQLRGFELLEDSLKDFSSYLERQNLRAGDLIGRAADQRKSFGDMPLRTDNWRNYVPKI
jgi:dihydroorotate dehydrogenase (NAD+) catalytic subunit